MIFDVIIGIEWIHICYAYLDYSSCVVGFYFPNKEEFILKG